MSDVRDGIAAYQTVRVTVPEAPAAALAGTGAWQARGACPRFASLAAALNWSCTSGRPATVSSGSRPYSHAAASATIRLILLPARTASPIGQDNPHFRGCVWRPCKWGGV
jgi:hypothetical protein